MPNIHRYDCYTTGLISPEKLQELRQAMPPFLFAANYELKHIASSDAIFTTAPWLEKNQSLLYDGRAHIDAAYGGSDYTAFTCARRQRDGSIVIYGRLWKKDVMSVNEIIRRGGWGKAYMESQNKIIKIETYLKQAWERIRFLEGTDQAYLDQILDFTEYAEHDDAPDSAATVCRFFETNRWDGKKG